MSVRHVTPPTSSTTPKSKFRAWLEDYVERRNFFQARGLGGFKGQLHYINTDASRADHWQDAVAIHPNIIGSHYMAELMTKVLYEDVLGRGPLPAPVEIPWVN